MIGSNNKAIPNPAKGRVKVALRKVSKGVTKYRTLPKSAIPSTNANPKLM